MEGAEHYQRLRRLGGNIASVANVGEADHCQRLKHWATGTVAIANNAARPSATAEAAHKRFIDDNVGMGAKESAGG